MSNNITITFPDGNTKSVVKGISGLDLANQISKSLAKESVAIQIDGKISDLSLELNRDCKVCLLYTSPSPRDGLLSRMPSSA